MDYAQFIKSTKKRNRLVYTWLALSGILVTAGIILLVLHNKTGSFLQLVLASLCLTGIIVESIVLLSLAFTEKRRNYDLFQNNTIIIDKDTAGKLRKTDVLAIEQCAGNLKQTLQHIAISPDFTRAERMDYIMEWHDYEHDFVTQQYGAKPHRIAKTSQKRPLCTDGKEYVRAVCIRKYMTASTEQSSSEEMLDFGPYGKWEVNTEHLFYLTEPGDEFFLLMSSNGKRIVEAYSVLDWELSE